MPLKGTSPAKPAKKLPAKVLKGDKKKKRAGGVIEEEGISENMEDDVDLLNADQNNIAGIDQEQLTAEEKEANIIKTLNANNPQAAHNTTKFSYKDRNFKTDEIVEHLVFHFQYDGCMIAKDSDEARDQEEFWDNKKRTNQSLLDKINVAVKEEFGKDPLDGNDRAQKKSLRNQFNYQERSCQTFNLPLKERGIKTDPPVQTNFSLETTQWQIFDAYMAAYEEMQRAELEEQMKNKKDKKPAQQVVQTIEDPLYSASMKRALKIMERMIVQNADEEKFDDYKYYEDTTEEIQGAPKVGSVLPLWRFSTERSRKKHVTSIGWNPRYSDLFAVGYGSYDFLKQNTGLICCYTIKNPTYPEYQFATESGVMCLDFHPRFPALLAVGCYDGTVMVYDIRIKGNNKPIYQSTVRSSKHTDPVWQVRWSTDDITKNMSFYSISSDGRVTTWNLMKNKLEPEEVIKLKLVAEQEKGLSDGGKEGFVYGYAGGMCFDFNKFHDQLFLVGTEEGKIHLCSRAYAGQYLETYEGHYLAVYAVKWNNFHPRVFMSCSADWKIKMWDKDIMRPILNFDLGCAVGDIEWAPYSSTVFSAVTSAGNLYVWDLKQEKHTYMCEHPALKKAKALHVSFNKTDPIILVGDERGGVNSFKLSKSLTIGPLQPAEGEEQAKTSQQLEEQKMEDFLNSLDKIVY